MLVRLRAAATASRASAVAAAAASACRRLHTSTSLRVRHRPPLPKVAAGMNFAQRSKLKATAARRQTQQEAVRARAAAAAARRTALERQHEQTEDQDEDELSADDDAHDDDHDTVIAGSAQHRGPRAIDIGRGSGSAELDAMRARYDAKKQRLATRVAADPAVAAVASSRRGVSITAVNVAQEVQQAEADAAAEADIAPRAVAARAAEVDPAAGAGPRFDVAPAKAGARDLSTVYSVAGVLTLAATPIGNLADMSKRLAQVLRDADVVYCEDTRHSATLFSSAHVPSRPNVFSYHAHSPATIRDQVSERLRQGQHVLYISDAGMPAVSDPGAELVALAYEMGARVDVVPGPSAVTTAVALSGLHSPNGEFAFLGFFPRSAPAQDKLMERLSAMRMLAVLFEAPHRMDTTLAFLGGVLPPNTQLVVCREMTKVHQRVYRGTAQELLELVPHFKGEFVILIPPLTEPLSMSLQSRYAFLLSEAGGGMSPKQAIRELSQQMSLDKRKIAQMLQQQQQQEAAPAAGAAASQSSRAAGTEPVL